MRPLQIIRSRLGVTQGQLAERVGVTQPSISYYERGATIPPDVACRIADLAIERGLNIGLDHVYGRASVPAPHTMARRDITARDAGATSAHPTDARPAVSLGTRK